MTKTYTDATLLDEYGAVFVDPKNVGSSLRWNVEVTQRTFLEGGKNRADVSASLAIADCTRTVTWENYSGSLLDKVEETINELRRLRTALMKADMIVIKANKGIPEEDE